MRSSPNPFRLWKPSNLYIRAIAAAIPNIMCYLGRWNSTSWPNMAELPKAKKTFLNRFWTALAATPASVFRFLTLAQNALPNSTTNCNRAWTAFLISTAKPINGLKKKTATMPASRATAWFLRRAIAICSKI